MKRLLLSLGILCSVGLSTTACQTPNTSDRTGTLSIKVQFPERNSFSVKLIPEETRAIYVVVYEGKMFDREPLVFGPITNKNPRVNLKHLDSGEKTVVAATYDANKNMLTADETMVFVKPAGSTQVGLDMQQNLAAELSEATLRFMQNLNVNIPELDAEQPDVLTPVNRSGPPITLSSIDRNLSVPEDGDNRPARDTESSNLRLEVGTQGSKEDSETPVPTPTPYYGSSGGGGGGGGFIAPAPTAPPATEPEPTPEPTPMPSMNPRVNVIDGSGITGPAQGSSQGEEN